MWTYPHFPFPFLDQYAFGKVTHDDYIETNIQHDRATILLQTERAKLTAQVPLLHKADVVDLNIRRYCEAVKARFEMSEGFESKRKFLMDYIEKIIFVRDSVTVCGSVPIRLKAYEDPDQPSTVDRIEFKIAGLVRRSREDSRKLADPIKG